MHHDAGLVQFVQSVQVVKEAGLNTFTRVLVTRGQDDISEVWQVLASKSLHRRSPSPARI